MSEELGSLQIKLGLDGASFNDEMKNINTELSNLGSQLKEQASRADGFGSSLQGMKSKASILTQEINLQKDKLSNLNSEYQRAVQEHGSMSVEALTLQTRMNGVQTAINKLEKQLNSTNTSISNMQNKWLNLSSHLTEIEGKFKSMGSTMKDIGQTLTMSISAPLAGVAAFGVKYNATMEDLQTSFKVMLGSEKAAIEMTQKLVKMGAETPFESTQLAEYTKTMLSFGYTSQNVLPIMSRLGDISLGNSEKMSSLTRTMGQINSLGKLQGGDLNQLIGQGWNPLNEITKKTGETMEQVRKRMEDGKISYKEVENALIATTSAGGQFFNGMAEGSKTFNGQLSTLKDTLSQTLGEATKPLFDYFKSELPKIIAFFADLGDKFKALSPDIKTAGLVLTALAAVLPPIILGAGFLLSGLGSLAGAFASVSTAIAGAGGLMAFLSASILPVIAVVSGLVAAGVLLYKNWDTVKESLKPVWQEITDTVNKAVKAIIDFVVPIIEKIHELWVRNADEILPVIRDFWTETIKAFKVGWEFIKGIVSVAWDSITFIFKFNFDLITDIMNVGFDILRGDWTNAWESFKQIFIDMWENIIGTGKKLITDFFNMVKGLNNTVETSIQTTNKKIVGEVSATNKVLNNTFAKTAETAATSLATIPQTVGEATKKAVDVMKKAFDASKEWIDDRKYYNQLSLNEELDAWKRVQEKFKAGTEERKKAEREVYRVQKELVAQMQETLKKSFAESKSWIDERKFYNELSLKEELDAWLRVQEKFKEGTEERKQANKEVYRVQQEISDSIKNLVEKTAKEIGTIEKEYNEQYYAVSQEAKNKRLQLETSHLEEVKKVVQKGADEIAQLQEKYETALASKRQQIYSSMGLFDAVEKKPIQNIEVMGKQLALNLQDQVSQFDSWQRSISYLVSRGLDEGLVKEIREKGVQSYYEVQALTTLTDPELTRYVELWRTKNRQATDEAAFQMKKMKDNTEAKIKEINATTSTELEKMRVEYDKKLTEINEVTSLQLTALDTAFQEKTTAIRKGFKRIMTDMVLDARIKGENLMDALIQEINAKESAVVAACKRVADQIASTFKTVLQIKSPSRVMMEIGGYITEGLALGIDSEKLKVTSAVNNLITVPSLPSIPAVSGGNSINITIQGNLVGSNGMNELADIISNKISGKYSLSIGGR